MEKNPKQELKELSPFLAKLREKEDGFKVPEGYFEQLQKEVLQKALPEEPGHTRSAERRGFLRILPREYTGWAAAAAVAGLILAGWWLSQPTEPTSESPLAWTTSISAEEATAYLNAHVEDYELALLVEELDQPVPVIQDPIPLDPQVEEYLEEMELDELEEIF